MQDKCRFFLSSRLHRLSFGCCDNYSPFSDHKQWSGTVCGLSIGGWFGGILWVTLWESTGFDSHGHLCSLLCPNDVNGNPRRIYVLLEDEGAIVAVWDEGYMGSHAVPGVWREDAYNAPRVYISGKEYRRILKEFPSPQWAHDVPGFSHLRAMA